MEIKGYKNNNESILENEKINMKRDFYDLLKIKPSASFSFD